jgi:hypothetical protein
MACSLSVTIIGRSGLRANLLPLLLILALAGLAAGLQRNRLWPLIVAGVSTGLLPYSYISARFVPLLLLLLAASYCWLHWSTVQEDVRRRLPGLALYFALALLIALPILWHFALHPEDFSSRSRSLLIFDPQVNSGHLWRALGRNILDHLAVFGFYGDANWRHNYDGRPFLAWFEAIFFWIGLALALWRWSQLPYRMLLFWFAVLLLPAVLSLDHSPNTFRMIGVMPVVFVLMSVGLWESLAFVLRKAGVQHRLASPLLFALLALGLLSYRYLDTYRTYFTVWATNPEVYQSYHSEWTEFARIINAPPSGSRQAYIIPIGDQYNQNFQEYNFDFLYQGTTPAHLLYANSPDAARLMQTMLLSDSQSSPLQQVHLVDWTSGVHWSGDSTNRFFLLLSKYGRYQSSETHTNYSIHTFTDVNLEPAWALYETIDPLQVIYDGKLELTGLALGQHGGQPLAAANAVVERTALPLWLALQWRASDAPRGDYAVSIRLHNDKGEQLWQKDEPLLGFDGWGTTRWQAGERSESMLILDLPADLPAGRYALRAVVYDRVTLAPTVQVGIWQPEVTLAELTVR